LKDLFCSFLDSKIVKSVRAEILYARIHLQFSLGFLAQQRGRAWAPSSYAAAMSLFYEASICSRLVSESSM